MTSHTGGSSRPPYFLGHVSAKKPASYNLACQSPSVGPVRVVAVRTMHRIALLRQPPADLLAEFGLCRGVMKVHGSLPIVAARCTRVAARRRRTNWSPTASDAETRVPCTPTCCRCRRGPGSMSRTQCGRPAMHMPWPPQQPVERRPEAARRPPTPHSRLR